MARWTSTLKLQLGMLDNIRGAQSHLLVFLTLTTFSAHAQLRTATSPLLTPPMPLVDPEGAFGVDINPSTLGFAEGWRLSGLLSRAAEGPTDIHRSGESISGVLPIFGGFAAGFSAASIRPSGPDALPSRGMASLAASFAIDKRFSLGTALRFVMSADPQVDEITTWDLSLSHRPSPFLSWSLIGKDLSRPRPAAREPAVPRSGTLAIGVRPFQHDALTIELAGALGESGYKGLRSGIYSRVPHIGRLGVTAETQGIYEGDNPYNLFDHILVTAGLSAEFGHAQVGGGTYLTHHKGDSASPGWYLSATLSQENFSPAWGPGYAWDTKLESDSGPSWVRTLHTLSRAANTPKLQAVVIRMRTRLSLAHAQELMAAIETLRSHHKFVMCHFETASQNAFYACSAANRTTIDPAGMVELMGFANTTLLFGKTLNDIGVRADFVRIGKYKSAPEQFSQSASSDPAREQREAFATDIYDVFVQDLARLHKKSPETIRAWVDQGPYMSQPALNKGMLSESADGFDLDKTLEHFIGHSLTTVENLPETPSRYWGYPPRVGVLLVDGMIVDGESVDIPGIGLHLSGGETLVKAIDKLAQDPSVGAIVVRIDSGGGSAVASDQVWRALMRAREKKPVVASMGSIAASGGYYIASAAQKIFALPTTLTGSIGIFFGKADLAELAKKIGIGVEFTTRGKHAGADSLWRPFTDEERHVLQEIIQESYQQFLTRISTSRHMSIDAIDKLGQGRVWSGVRAKAHGLIDVLGDLNAAIAYAKKLAKMPKDTEITLLPKRPENLFEYIVSSNASASAHALTPLIKPLGQSVNWLWMLTQGPVPLALPEVILSPP